MFFMSSQNKSGHILRALVLLSAFLAGSNCFVKQALAVPAAATASPAEAVAFVRGSGNQGGDIFLWDAQTRQSRQLTHGKQFSDLGVMQGKIACLSSPDGSIYLLRAPNWHPERLPVGTRYSGKPCWLEGKAQFLIGRSHRDGVDGDGGLWQIDVDRGSARRLLPNYDADFAESNRILLSPLHDKALSLGGSDALILRMVDMRTGRSLPGMSGQVISGGEDAAWLDENNLLVACSSQTSDGEKAQGGLRLVNLKTRRLSRWLYSPASNVTQIVRSTHGLRFVAVLDSPNRIELIDKAAKIRHPLSFHTPAAVEGFSGDDQELLLNAPKSIEKTSGTIYVLNLQTNQKQLVARNASEAAWLTP